MKLFKNIAIILALLLCWSTLLAGCSQKAENAADVNAADGNEAATEEENMPGEKLDIEVEEQPSEENADTENTQTDVVEEPKEETEQTDVVEEPKEETERTDVVEEPKEETAQTEEVEENADNTTEKADNTVVFNSEYLLNAIAECLGKDTFEVTTEDILGIKYLAIGPEEDGTQTVYVGLDDYADYYFSEAVSVEGLSELVKTASIENVDDVEADLGKFENLEVFEYYNIPISDVSFLKNYNNLYFGYFNENGIEDVSTLSDYNPVTLRELDFTGNDIQDWTPVYHIKDKVIVDFRVSVMMDEDNNEVEVPFILTLADMLENENETDDAEQENSDAKDSADETPSEDVPAVSFEDADFSVLFE